MDKIFLSGMEFFGFHGVFPEENKLGQKFFVDLILELPLKDAGLHDNIENSVDYGEAYMVTRSIVEGKPRKLLEAVAEDVCDKLLTEFKRLKAVTVKISKPGAPIKGYFDTVGIEIRRERS
ncbi:dihydroneopterin aldolase [Salirhabdus salicampi]|uniref:dihydroneopterin aldolase n=1 Tax=Salirhabdus salicampi TaxID=476102 RepID=UPI0020C43A20|nr:dihydroneopterin aldolase [Salirhabdus salicampi]MCP8618196.1 dihydroneopterin aldolase [Salirhabdus salicampi]